MQNWLLARSKVSASKAAVISDSHTVTFGQLKAEVDAAARGLLESGLGKGDRIGLAVEAGLGFVVGLHAIARIGGIAIPLSTKILLREQQHQIHLTRAKAVLFDGPHESLAQVIGLPLTSSVRLDSRIHVGIWGVSSQPHLQTMLLDAAGTDDVHSIVFTSGTTQEAKGVCLTWGNHWWNAFGSMLNLGSQSNDIWLDCLPLNHVGGLSILLRSVLYGVPVRIHAAFDPDAVGHAIDEQGITMISLVSTMLHRLLEARGHRPFPNTLRCILLGGGPIPSSLVEDCIEAGIPIAPTYGLTETASQAATMHPSLLSERRDSVGKPLIGIDMRILAGDTVLPVGETGEIALSGPALAQQYYGPAPVTTGRDGWFQTGDLGCLDPDGYLHVSGRRTDLIVTGGENVYPGEVEDILRGHPSVKDVAVFSIPDPEWGQAVTAAVVCPDSVSQEELFAFCRPRLAGFKCPKQIFFRGELPRTASGKLQRDMLREEFLRKTY